jgi:hypothetical protein
MSVGEIELIKMSGLRVFINPAETSMPGEPGVFYSRRLCGPYYRWCFEKGPGRWRCARVHPSLSALKVLRIAGWNAVPPVLRAKLDEHYLD